MKQSSFLNDRATDAVANRTMRRESEKKKASADTSPVFRDYHAPRNHGESFVEPAISAVPAVLEENRQLLASHTALDAMRRGARTKLIEDAIRYTSAYRSIDWLAGKSAQSLASKPILMAGHQPSLFHSGVWFKNFALSHVAKQTDALAVNLVIDNDVASGSSIRVPTADSSTKGPWLETVAYDVAGGGVPYEQTTIRNREIFDHFDREVQRSIAPLVDDPCITRLWQHAKSAIARCGVAGCALAQARHGLEDEIGLETLELPLGVVCRTTEFAEFVLAILSELPRFHQCYNEATNQYRRSHGIRSTAHPVPNLAEEDGWFEAPLWIYGNDSPARRAVWVRLSDDNLVISDRVDREFQVDIRYPKLAAEQLAGQMSPNFKLRPRALLTTMYARLILSDLFIHGIGGAKYDQLGDIIIQSYFIITPPQFMVISATITLPGVPERNDVERIRDLKRQLRETHFQPERFSDRVELDDALLKKKQRLLANRPPRGERKQWHDQLTCTNQILSRSLADLRGELKNELATLQRVSASHKLLASREHPFCLFPLGYLQQTYRQLLDK